MGMFAGGFLRLFSTFIYFIEFCCAGIGLSIYSYFLAKLSIHHLHIANDWKAVEGLTGAAVLYTVFAVILTCILGGSPFFAVVGIVLNVIFCGAFVAVAILTKDGAHSCSGIVHTPLGTGLASLEAAGTHLSLACHLNTAVFATAIIAALLFAVSVFLQFLMMRHHQKEKKYGPSPANNYTSGSAGRFGFFKSKPKATQDAFGDSTAYPPANRVSHETGYTGTTMTQSDAYGNGTYGNTNKYDTYGNPAPAGTAVNY